MPNHVKKTTTSSSSPSQQPSNAPKEPTHRPASEIEHALNVALESGDDNAALEVLNSAPSWMKRQPEFMMIRATVLLSLGDDQEALRLMLEIKRKHPRFTALNLPLAMLYMDQELYAHALQASKLAISDRELTDEDRDSLEDLIEEAVSVIRLNASELGLTFETMQRACIFHEQALMALDENKLSEAENFFKEATKIIPQWNSPRNNRALVLYYLGKTKDAIAVLEEVLARDAEDAFAMKTLVTFHIGLDQPELAQDYASRLVAMSKKFPADSMEIEYVIMALALLEDTTTLWKIAKRYLNAPTDHLFGRSWQCLSVAAIRSGMWKDALKLIKKVDEAELSPAGKKYLDELEAIADQHQPHLPWMPPGYPGADLFLHSKVMAEWDALSQDFSKPLTHSQKRKLDSFFQKYPFMVVAIKRLLWEENSHPFALQTLGQMGTPEADGEILRFALSQTGNQEARISAIMQLIQTGRYTGPKVVKIWNEDINEWHDVELNTQRIGDIEPNAQPKTLALIEKATKSKNPQEAVALLQKAIELEPTCPIAVFNLGVLLTQSGKTVEGEALIHRSVEIDPNYTFGHASIALSEAKLGHEQVALDHLEVVTRAEFIAPETAVLANLAWVSLAIHKHNLKSARQHFDLAAKIDPEHRLLERYEKILKEAEEIDKMYGFIFELRRKSNLRSHQKLLKTPLTAEMGLRACLEMNTKEMLVGSARFLRTSASGKKGEIVSRLTELLLDIEFLQQTLDENLEEKEREALQWMLETNGVRPWKEFVRKYGDDMEESTLWAYQEPESIPGRLRMSGLFYSGVLNGQKVAFIPADARLQLRKLLK